MEGVPYLLPVGQDGVLDQGCVSEGWRKGEMKRQIIVTIDCEEKYCGDCDLCGPFDHDCWAFNVNLHIVPKGLRRCPACLKAEVKR